MSFGLTCIPMACSPLSEWGQRRVCGRHAEHHPAVPPHGGPRHGPHPVGPGRQPAARPVPAADHVHGRQGTPPRHPRGAGGCPVNERLTKWTKLTQIALKHQTGLSGIVQQMRDWAGDGFIPCFTPGPTASPAAGG